MQRDNLLNKGLKWLNRQFEKKNDLQIIMMLWTPEELNEKLLKQIKFPTCLVIEWGTKKHCSLYTIGLTSPN